MTLEGKPLNIAIIKFKDGRELTDRPAAIAGNFLIVGDGYEDVAADWYNTDSIAELEGVTVCTDTEIKQEGMLYALFGITQRSDLE